MAYLSGASHFKFLLTCLLRGMTRFTQHFHAIPGVSTHMPLARHDVTNYYNDPYLTVSTHMPLARHDPLHKRTIGLPGVSTHMPLARHDRTPLFRSPWRTVSTHMPLARHDVTITNSNVFAYSFYSHASCEA